MTTPYQGRRALGLCGGCGHGRTEASYCDRCNVRLAEARARRRARATGNIAPFVRRRDDVGQPGAHVWMRLAAGRVGWRCTVCSRTIASHAEDAGGCT